MDNLLSVDEMREMEGLALKTHETLEDIVRRIKDGGVCISLEQSNIDVE